MTGAHPILNHLAETRLPGHDELGYFLDRMVWELRSVRAASRGARIGEINAILAPLGMALSRRAVGAKWRWQLAVDFSHPAMIQRFSDRGVSQERWADLLLQSGSNLFERGEITVHGRTHPALLIWVSPMLRALEYPFTLRRTLIG